MESNRSLRPQQLGNDKTRAGNMAMWVAPIRVYYHLSREIHLIPYYIRCCPIRETVADPNRW